jgi:predicted transcriptional regulator
MKQAEPLHIIVRKTMLDKGLVQKDLMKKFKVSQSYIAHALNGKRDSLLQKISDYVSAYKVRRAA